MEPLRDPEIQRIILGTEVKMEEAYIEGWTLSVDDDSYYFYREDEGSKVQTIQNVITM